MSSIIKPVLGSQLEIGHLLTKDLVGLWLFNEGSGRQVFDLSGNNNTGTFVNSVTWQAGYSRLDFAGNGDNSYVQVPKLPPNLTNQLTIIHSITFDDFDDYSAIVDSRNAVDTGFYTYVYTTTNDFRFRVLTDGSSTELDSRTLNAGQRYVLAAVYDGSKQYIYVDGVYDNSNNASGNIVTHTGTMRFGIKGWGTLNDDLDAKLDWVIIYNRALSASEIALLYREPFCMFERDPIELWSAATLGAAPPAGIPIFRRRRECA